MKKIALAAAAIFALFTGSSLRRRYGRQGPGPVVAPVAVYSWTGFYIGSTAVARGSTSDWDAAVAYQHAGGCAVCPRPRQP